MQYKAAISKLFGSRHPPALILKMENSKFLRAKRQDFGRAAHNHLMQINYKLPTLIITH